MKIAFATQDQQRVDAHFGWAKYLAVYQIDAAGYQFVQSFPFGEDLAEDGNEDKLAPKLDTVIIASGDGDFVPLVEYLQTNQGCQVEVIAFGRSSSSALRAAADDFIDMCDNSRKFILRPNNNRGNAKPNRLQP